MSGEIDGGETVENFLRRQLVKSREALRLAETEAAALDRRVADARAAIRGEATRSAGEDLVVNRCETVEGQRMKNLNVERKNYSN